MSWVKIGDEVADLPKTLAVWAQDPAAFALDVRATLYSAKHLTDGFVPALILDVWFPERGAGEATRLTRILIEAGRWEAVEGGFLLHDFLDSNRSREEVEAERAKRQRSGRRGGRKSAQTRRQKVRQILDEQFPEEEVLP